jgi:D-alanyl-D-alanine carboxypeptidase (penicillin-binding protein 5/6)
VDVLKAVSDLGPETLCERKDTVDDSLRDLGVTLKVYGRDELQVFPLDAVPRIIPADQWARISAGIEQRARAMELFLRDIYGPGEITRAGVVPAEALERGTITWNDTTIVSSNAWQKEGSTMFLPWNQPVTIEDLIKGISIVSANDGCIALAEHLYGSEAAFVEQMNRRAGELGMTGTVFKNSTGLPAEGHVMTARDIAILSRELLTRHPKVLEFESQREFTYNGIRQDNRNPLLGRYEGADGLKTGWTDESGFSLVGTAERDGRRLISVVLNTDSDTARRVASEQLLNYGYRNFSLATTAAAGSVVGEVTVIGGRRPTVGLVVTEDAVASIPQGRTNDIELVIEARELIAPVSAGTNAGVLHIRLDGETLHAVPVSTAEAMGRANFLVRAFRGLANFFRGLFRR